MKSFKTFSVIFSLMVGTITQVSAQPTNSSSEGTHSLNAVGNLSIATWNVEHLAYPIDQGCKPRDNKQISQLRDYAASLDADIVALQEVASKAAVANIFPDDEWQIFVSDRADSEAYTCRRSGFTSTQQKVAFAVKKSLSVKNVFSRSEFGLERSGLRYGLELQVMSQYGIVSLLNLHLKSGCFVDYHSRTDSEACQVFSKQVPVLDKWIEEKEALGQPYIVLGDFNHRLAAPYNQALRTFSDNQDKSQSTLFNATGHMLGCSARYPAPIDHIFVGHMSQASVNFDAKVHYFDDMRREAMLSDHCAFTLNISEKQNPLTNSVKWQTQSAEYKFLTARAYQQAERTLASLELPTSSWVVVMDIDETILDNSAYQVNLDHTGGSFTPASWDAWVASEKATMVPGAKSFMHRVLALGGKLALVTNRNRQLDNHTWNNLIANGINVSMDNACLMGRVSEDKAAINEDDIKNDKDLRRAQVTNGTASCFNHQQGNRHNTFGKHQIIMQVGDNIEDFSLVTQEHADSSVLINNPRLILLPNAMYGSW